MCALVADAARNLYGTTTGGGANGEGTIFKIAFGTNKLTTLATFTGTNGSSPQSSLIADAAGDLFGTTFSGGANGDGTIYELPAGGSGVTTLFNFDGSDGSGPVSGLISDASGNLYGTTFEGGLNNDGTVYELTNTGFVVPEPGSLTLAAIGAVALLCRRHRPEAGALTTRQ